MKSGVNISVNAIFAKIFYKNTKKSFYKNLDEKQVSDNKVFWKTVNPIFSDKIVNSAKITLVEKN